MRISHNNVNFSGYKNLLHADIASNDSHFILFTSQLFDDDKNKDLSYFRDIITRSSGSKDADVLNLMYIKNSNERGRFIFNGNKLLWGDELSSLYNAYINGNLNKAEYKNVESFNTKAYTLLASLTRRIMNNGLSTKDKDFVHVYKNTNQELNRIINNEKTTFEILQYAIFEKKPIQKLALSINRTIVKTMQKFL